MSRRRLGASLPPDQRLVAYELRIREHQAAIEVIEDALVALDTGYAMDGRRVTLAGAEVELRAAIHGLQGLKNRPIGRRPGPKPATETVATS